MKVVFFGTPEFAVPSLEMLNEYYDVCLVVTQPDKYGNHNKVIPSAVKAKAIELGIEVFQPTSIKDDYEKILNCNADIMVTAAYGQFIPSKLLNKFKFRLNVHGSLLPKYRGGAPIQRSIINGDKETGVTIMKMEKRMDSGAMYGKKVLPILNSDTNETLFTKLSILGRDLLKELLPDILNGNNIGVMQNEDEATYAYNLTREEELIDFNRTSLEIFNQVRGLAVNPGAYFKFKDQPYKIYKTEIVEDNSNNKAGTILSVKKNFIIKTKDGALKILVIKPAGKKMMEINNFLNGQRIFKECDIIE